jgi:branched-chain amino acid transport system substrate-binding protein
MIKSLRIVAAAATLALMANAATAQETIKIAGILELSGPGAGVGTNQKQGLEIAVKEINAKGGILGKKIELTFYDTQTAAAVARGLVQKALSDLDPYAIIGPTFSGSFAASYPLSQQAGVPQFTGGTAPNLTAPGNSFAFRTYLNQDSTIPKLMGYMGTKLSVKKLAIVWANSDFGKGAHTAVVREAAKLGIQIVADISTEVGQADFGADIVKVKNSGADAMLLYTHEEESARALVERQRQGLTMPIFGEQTVLNPKVIELAGKAAVGVRGFVGLTGDAPDKTLQDFQAKYRAAYKDTPDHNGFQGYLAGYVIKVITNRVGKLDRAKFAETLHNATITVEEEPGILITTKWLANGDTERAGYIGEVGPDNKIKIVDTTPAN